MDHIAANQTLLLKYMSTQLKEKVDLIKSLNPVQNKTSTPQIAMLRHQLGIQSKTTTMSESSTLFDSVGGVGGNSNSKDGGEMTLEKCLEIFGDLEREIKGFSQAYLDKEKASQSIMAKLSHNQHQAVRNAHMEVGDLVDNKVSMQVADREKEIRESVR